MPLRETQRWAPPACSPRDAVRKPSVCSAPPNSSHLQLWVQVLAKSPRKNKLRVHSIRRQSYGRQP